MLRLVNHIPPRIHLLLFVLIPLLRIPSFDTLIFLTDESLYLLNAQRLQAGAALYEGAWHMGPPLMVWLYGFFVWVFGSGALQAIGVFTCFYIYVAAVYFNGMLAENRFFQKYLDVSSLLYVILVSVPWYAQELNASLFVLLPMTIAFRALTGLSDNRKQNYVLLFQVGFWMMVCLLSSYKSLFILLGILLGYIMLKRPHWDEFFALLGGMMVLFIPFILILIWQGTLGAWWDMGVLFFLDRLGFEGGLYQLDRAFSLQVWLISWGSVLALALAGFIHFRLRFFSYLAQIRTIEITMAIWLGTILLVVLFKLNRLELSDFLLLVPPVVFYASKAFDFAIIARFRWVVLMIIVSVPLYLYSGYWGLRFPEALSVFHPGKEQRLLHGDQWDFFQGTDPLINALAGVDAPDGIWILDHRPAYYHLLHQSIQHPFTDFRMVYYKFPDMPGYSGTALRSRPTEDKDIFLAFSERLPNYIVDPAQYFPKLQAKYPGIFGAFKGRAIGSYTLYTRP